MAPTHPHGRAPPFRVRPHSRWLTLALVLTQFALAETWNWFDRSTPHLMIVAHMSFGIILGAIILLQIM